MEKRRWRWFEALLMNAGLHHEVMRLGLHPWLITFNPYRVFGVEKTDKRKKLSKSFRPDELFRRAIAVNKIPEADILFQ